VPVIEAFYWLDRALTQKDAAPYFIKVSLLLGKIQKDPRYAALLRRVNLEPQRTARIPLLVMPVE